MKITKLRKITSKGNVKLSDSEFNELFKELELRLTNAGLLYNTYIEKLNSTSFKISGNSRSFSIDVQKLGYNAQHNPFLNGKGFRRTNLPTWDQRVEFNNIVNAVFTEMNLVANIKSGFYVIRQGSIELKVRDWVQQKPSFQLQNEASGIYITKLEQSV
jgi:hypothetical protein